MFLIRYLLKLIAIPFTLAVTLLQWLCVFAASLSSAVCYMISGGFIACALLGFFFRAITGAETLEMLAVALVLLLFTVFGQWLITAIGAINRVLRNFITD